MFYLITLKYFQCKAKEVSSSSEDLFFSRCGHTFHKICAENNFCVICVERWTKAVEVKGTQFNNNIMDFTIKENKPDEAEEMEVEDNFDKEIHVTTLSEAQKLKTVELIQGNAEKLKSMEQKDLFISECQHTPPKC